MTRVEVVKGASEGDDGVQSLQVGIVVVVVVVCSGVGVVGGVGLLPFALVLPILIHRSVDRVVFGLPADDSRRRGGGGGDTNGLASELFEDDVDLREDEVSLCERVGRDAVHAGEGSFEAEEEPSRRRRRGFPCPATGGGGGGGG